MLWFGCGMYCSVVAKLLQTSQTENGGGKEWASGGFCRTATPRDQKDANEWGACEGENSFKKPQ